MKTIVKNRLFLGVLGSVLFFCTLISSKGFSLLGPFTPWMTPDLGYFPNQGDIGGPMAIGEEYRWNVPVLTYGFDQSFIDYFGQPGIDAVEQAIQVINDLPPSSNIVLSNYPLDTIHHNYQAQAQTLFDLKSITLSLLLEQLGLTSPSRYIWTLRHWDADAANHFYQPSKFLDGFGETDLEQAGFIPEYGVQLNYDPTTLQPTNSVNQVAYGFFLHAYDTNLSKALTAMFTLDPSVENNGSIADYLFWNSPGLIGQFCTGLSQDDVGGLCFLLSRTNVHTETLDDSVIPAPANINTVVRTAPRPGIEKLTFQRHSTNTLGNFVSMTNQFTDVYFTNGLQATQLVERVTDKPDFLFSVKDLGFSLTSDTDGNPHFGAPVMQRSGTSNWSNNCILNTNPGGAGPGVIHRPVQIVYQNESKYVAAAGGLINDSCTGALFKWGNFSGSGESIVHTGNQTNITCLTLSSKVISNNGTPTLEWLVLGHQGARYRIESSTNLSDWTATGSIINVNGIFILRQPLDQPARYFRTILEE